MHFQQQHRWAKHPILTLLVLLYKGMEKAKTSWILCSDNSHGIKVILGNVKSKNVNREGWNIFQQKIWLRKREREKNTQIPKKCTKYIFSTSLSPIKLSQDDASFIWEGIRKNVLPNHTVKLKIQMFKTHIKYTMLSSHSKGGWYWWKFVISSCL